MIKPYFETGNGKNKICIYCNNIFTKPPKETYKQWNKRKYCSEKCYGLDKKIKCVGSKNVRWKGGYIEKECPYCKNKFSVKLKNRLQIYCSKKHFAEDIKIKNKGEGNPFYGRKHTKESKEKFLKTKKIFKHTDAARQKMSESRKGLKFTLSHRQNLSKALTKTPIEITSQKKAEKARIRKLINYKIWRESIFKRDNYACQYCGDRSGNGHTVYLEAHHIKSFHCYPELRFDTDNGITLCRNCHRVETGKQIKNNSNKVIKKCLQV